MEKETLIKQCVEYYKNGIYSCSEVIVYACLIKNKKSNIDSYLNAASGFRAGIAGLNLTCGLISGCVIAYSTILDSKSEEFDNKIFLVNKLINDLEKSNACANITSDYEFHSTERKEHCTVLLENVLNLVVDDFICNN